MKKIVEETLKSFGLSYFYRGFPCAVHAVLLVIQDESCLDNVMSDIYAPTASALHVPVNHIERNVRTLVQRAWQVDKDRLSRIADYKLDGEPSAAQFISIIASYVRKLSS